MIKRVGLFYLLWILMSCVALLAQTSSRRVYVYDETRQLVGVIDEEGNRLSYTYDAAGNLISVERLSARGPVDIFFLEPNRGRAAVPPQPGTPVTIHGVGFSAVPTENRVTFFNGVAAVVDSATATTIRTSVPVGATTGPVQVTSPQGTATSRSDFTVITGILVTISPATRDVAVRQGQQFTATVTEGGRVIPTNVVWSVNGIVGGNPTVGTIDRNGLYRAPTSIPRPPTVTVTATSVEEMTVSGNAAVTIVQGIGPVYTQGSSYRVPRPDPSRMPLASIFNQGASYRVPRPDPNRMPLASIFNQGASYRVPRPDPNRMPLASIFNQGASYRVPRPDPNRMPLASIFNQGASYTTIVITGLSLNRVSRGTMDRPFTVTGRNFNGATALDFLLLSGARDVSITAASLTVNPDGTQITVRISVAEAASIGARTVVVRTPTGVSTTMATDSNQLVIE
jgi:YD repeat-containing protein